MSPQDCSPGPGRSAARGPPAPWRPPPPPAAPAAPPSQPLGLAPGTPRPASPCSPPAASPADGGDNSGQVRAEGGDGHGAGCGGGAGLTWASCSWASELLSSLLSRMALDSASLRAPDTFSSSACGEGAPSNGAFRPADPSRSSPSNPRHTGQVAMISRGQLLGRPAWRIPQQFNAEFPYGPHSPGEGSPLVSLTNHYYPQFT